MTTLPWVVDHRQRSSRLRLFEGLLALWSASSYKRCPGRAAHTVDLFMLRFLPPIRGALCEYLDDELGAVHA